MRQPTVMLPNGVMLNAHVAANDSINVKMITTNVFSICECIFTIMGTFHIKWRIMNMCERYIPKDRLEKRVITVVARFEKRIAPEKNFITFHQNTH